MAIDELNREMVKAKVRAEVGSSAYSPACALKKTNKRFLKNTIKSALTFNKRKGHSTRIRSMKQLIQVGEKQSPSSSSCSSSAYRAPSNVPPPPPNPPDPDEIIILD